MSSKETEDREFRSLERIRDNYPKYVLTTDFMLQKRNGIAHENIIDFMKNGLSQGTEGPVPQLVEY